MQGCSDHLENVARGHLTIRWCATHESWVVAAWAKLDGDAPFVEVHPMWLEPRTIPDVDGLLDTLRPLLTSLRSTVLRLERERGSGQMTLW